MLLVLVDCVVGIPGVSSVSKSHAISQESLSYVAQIPSVTATSAFYPSIPLTAKLDAISSSSVSINKNGMHNN